ncbi:hypothetical protein ACQ4M3_19030 [Leptolyngbya sp. AN03gr2]|uniref:hypothetical protein n=1 Tax=Leptolyngbya sp. AN03gr2 TaxID=3423364 RepID=UPI003D320B40
MSTNLFLTIVNGVVRRVQAISVSSGVSDANKIISTDSTGLLSPTILPSGIGAQTESIVASEALVAGDFVNIYDNAGARNVRKADNSNNRPARGFVLTPVSSAATALVYTTGRNTAMTGLTPGTVRFLGTAGSSTSTPPVAPNLHQNLGFATSSTSLLFEYDEPIILDA